MSEWLNHMTVKSLPNNIKMNIYCLVTAFNFNGLPGVLCVCVSPIFTFCSVSFPPFPFVSLLIPTAKLVQNSKSFTNKLITGMIFSFPSFRELCNLSYAGDIIVVSRLPFSLPINESALYNRCTPDEVQDVHFRSVCR